MPLAVLFKATHDATPFTGIAGMPSTFLELPQPFGQPATEMERAVCVLPEPFAGGMATALLHSSLGQQFGQRGFGVISLRGIQVHLPLRDFLAGLGHCRFATGHALPSAAF